MRGLKVRRESAPVPKQSEDFDLLIESAGKRRGTGKRYKVRLFRSPEGQSPPDSEHFFSERDLKLLFGSGEVWRDLGPKVATHKVPEEIGAEMFRALISGEIQRLWDRSLTAVRSKRQGLRLVLRLGAVPELEAWPWELLYDRSQFLALADDISVVRYLENPTPPNPEKFTLPLKILVVIASPSDCDRLDGEREGILLNRALGELVSDGKVRIELLSPPTLPALERAMSESWHIVHFVGHGRFDAAEGRLLLEDESGKAQEVTGRKLKVLLKTQKEIQLVVLNSCVGAKTSEEDVFAGVAQSLVGAGIPAVVAMRSRISDRAALAFAARFYEALAKELPVDAALGEARRAMHADRGEDLEWSTPVLYMRSAVIVPAHRRWPQALAASLSAIALGGGVYWFSTVPDHSSDPACPSPPGLDLSLVKIGPGRFSMGAGGRPVQITKSYCLGSFEVTQGQWKQIMGPPRRQAKEGDDLPVGNVSWNDAAAFLSRLAAKDPSAHYRLPAEAQWEYAARAGTSSLFSFGEDRSGFESYGNCSKAGRPTPVGTFRKNPWGLYDMYGNVSEWVADWEAPLPDDPAVDPVGPPTGTDKIRRGGSFTQNLHCDSVFRPGSKPDRHNEDTGFRIVRDPVR